MCMIYEGSCLFRIP